MKLKTSKQQTIPAWTDELLERLGSQEDSVDGLTSNEIASYLSVCDSVARRCIREAIQHGKLEPCKKRIETITGRSMLVAAYRPVTNKEE